MSSNTKLEKFKTQYKFICMSASQTRQTITVFHCWGDCNWEVSPGGNEGWTFIVQHIRSLWRCGGQSPKSTLWSEFHLNNPRKASSSLLLQPPPPGSWFHPGVETVSPYCSVAFWSVLSPNIYKARACKQASCLPPLSTTRKGLLLDKCKNIKGPLFPSSR